MFVYACRQFFPDNARGLEDERVNIYYEDGLRFLRSKQDEYDLIINDAIDPLGHTAGIVYQGILRKLATGPLKGGRHPGVSARKSLLR